MFGRIVGIGFGVGAISLIIFIAWISQSLPDPNNLGSRSLAQSTKIYARDGKTILYDIHGEEKRTVVELADISPSVINATIATEDREFYSHQGVSIRGTIRSIWKDIVRGNRSQGGSTITQQLVKNAILTREKSIIRKVKEWVLAYQIERRFSKDEILKLYFNEIPYGGNAYGIEAAARMYFGKSAKDLAVSEAAMLVALVRGPTYYSPTGNHRDELVARTKFVIDNMVSLGTLSQEVGEAEKGVDILARVQPIRDPIVAPHFTLYIKDLLVQKYGELEVERGGLRVITTLDPKLQKIAEEEVAAGAEKNDKRGADNAALTAIDPRTGQILAMVGSRDFFDVEHDGQFNVATAVRNPGSSFKPIIYLSAFTRGYTPNTVIFDLKTDFGPDGSGKNFIPNNYDFREHGPLKMRQTLAGSLNIPAVKTLYLAGIPYTLDLAERLGYSTIDRERVGLALAIGGGGVRLVEHVGAFATIANDGVRHTPTGILRIEDRGGKILEEYQDAGEKVVDVNAVRELQDVMSDNAARSYVFGARNSLTLPDRPVAAKTGTTNDWKDGWTMGFTPSLAAGVWVGNNDNTAMNRGMDGVIVAAPIWQAFMRRATTDTKVERFKKAKIVDGKKTMLSGQLANETTIKVDKETGRKIPDECLSSWPAAYVSTVVVKEVHTILHYVDRKDPTGTIPKNPSADPMYTRWEEPVQRWAKKNKYVAKTPKDEDCDLRVSTSTPVVNITSPLSGQTIKTDSLPMNISATGFGSGQKAVYTVDGITVATIDAAPLSTTLNIGSLENGFHTIGVTVTDAAGSTASATIQINTLLQNKTTLYFVQPSSKTTIPAADFPYVVRVYASDPKGITSATLYLDGNPVPVDQVSSPTDPTISFSWATTPPGSYKLYVVVKTGSGKTVESDRVSVTVKE